ncbi:MAG TPA: pyruvate ferredoxin oxidoreductase [Rhodospirillales bacterium]|nr:pyruvate ferredoxin oxidoreductase [Rhodospirillales bacterium]
MRAAFEGSQAIARAVARCRPQVVAAYPITPQTHIVEGIAKLVADGEADCEVVSVESEFAAASVVLGAAAAGSRAYTATASQGVLLMAEVLYNIAGMRVPLVLTCANRAVSAPINIWNDHQDAMAVRDAGWIQLFCTDNQDAVDTTIQAFRITQETELPVMVCVDGFILTHLFEPVDLPDQEQIDMFLPPYRFSRTLDSGRPLTLGTLVGPEHYTEVRAQLHGDLEAAAEVILKADADWADLVGRRAGGLIKRDGPHTARIGVLTLGSVYGTLQEAARELVPDTPLRLMALRCFRPFPVAALREAVEGLTDLVVLERAIGPGAGGILANEVRAALAGLPDAPRVHGAVAGLGGRDIPLEILPRLLALAEAAEPVRCTVVDLRKTPPAPAGVAS